MDYLEKRIVKSLYKWTVEGHIEWNDATTNRYKHIMELVTKEELETVSYICKKKIANESYYFVLHPYRSSVNNKDFRVSIFIFKEKEYLYSKSFNEREIEGLWCEAMHSANPFGNFLRHLEPLDTLKNGLLEEGDIHLIKAIESTISSQKDNEILKRYAPQIKYLMQKVRGLEEEISILKKSIASCERNRVDQLCTRSFLDSSDRANGIR